MKKRKKERNVLKSYILPIKLIFYPRVVLLYYICSIINQQTERQSKTIIWVFLSFTFEMVHAHTGLGARQKACRCTLGKSREESAGLSMHILWSTL